MAHRLWTFALFVSLAAAQNPTDLFEKAPPDVETALRARISEFFQDHVDGKFRQAEALVADDSKDFYYTANKPKYLNFKITRIEYSDHFSKAKATVLCETMIPVMGFMNKPFPAPIPSYWKLEKGQWYWYIDPNMRNMSPMGKMKAYDGPPAAGAPEAPQMLPNVTDLDSLAHNILNQVAADKSSVRLAGTEPQTVVITNSMPGIVQLEILDGPPAGVAAQLDPKELKPGAKSRLTLRVKPGASAHSGTLNLRVVQTNHVIPVQILAK